MAAAGKGSEPPGARRTVAAGKGSESPGARRTVAAHRESELGVRLDKAFEKKVRKGWVELVVEQGSQGKAVAGRKGVELAVEQG